ncbi:LysR family transcriptional regulator [Vibrio renipiscarius]|uniref:Transcriptional regulator n=1 Tax=Vibrio renipiscarius TaxID=1461322 RepID=A0A0C2NSL1_9VIBR|nr:LysR family transcriptional regulator [Vibrio renipiscarius]KII76060.1 transcriptional regulator [Vibrio renipiscarius]KII79165.1 transcriptional regulator [Vibrio renipiscarius]
MINHINLNLLRSLQVLLEERHVSRAAARLNLTQSAVSRQLAQLRTLCADPLLVRNGNVLVATPKALGLLDRVNHVLRQTDELFSDVPFDPATWQQEFVFSSSDYVAQFIVPAVVSILTQQAPLVDLSYRLWQPDYLAQIQTTGIDLASTMLPAAPQQLSSIMIGQDNSVCLMRVGHPLMAKTVWKSEDIVRFPHLKITGGGDKDSQVDWALSQMGMCRRIAVKVPFFSVAVNALQSSDLLMVVPEHIAINLTHHAALAFRPLPFETEAHLYWLMWHPKFDQDKAHYWMRENVLKVMKQSPYSIGMI